MKINLNKIDRFYKSPLGSMAYNAIHRGLMTLVSSSYYNGKTIVASGALCVFDDLLSNAYRVAFQKFDEDDIPTEYRNRFCVMERYYWPYRSEDVDCVMMVHDVEFTDNPEPYLREAWRVLKGEGELFIIIPNRAGKWARDDQTPFGLGYPYTMEQMENLLGRAHFEICDAAPVLFAGPYIPKTRIGVLYQMVIEWFGRQFLIIPAGAYVIRARKRVYSPSGGVRVKATDKVKAALSPVRTGVQNPRQSKH